MHSCHGQKQWVVFWSQRDFRNRSFWIVYSFWIGQWAVVYIAQLVQIPSNWQSTPAISTIHKQFPTPILVYRCQVTLGYQRVVTIKFCEIACPHSFSHWCACIIYRKFRRICHNIIALWLSLGDESAMAAMAVSAGGLWRLTRLTYSPLFLWLAVPNKISVSFGKQTWQ